MMRPGTKHTCLFATSTLAGEQRRSGPGTHRKDRQAETTTHDTILQVEHATYLKPLRIKNLAKLYYTKINTQRQAVSIRN